MSNILQYIANILKDEPTTFFGFSIVNMLKKSNAEIVAIMTIICVVKVILMILINTLTGLSPSLRETDKSRKDPESDSRNTKATLSNTNLANKNDHCLDL